MKKIWYAFKLKLILKKYMFPVKRIKKTTLLSDLNIDSLTYIMIAVDIERIFNIKISEDNLLFDKETTFEQLLKQTLKEM